MFAAMATLRYGKPQRLLKVIEGQAYWCDGKYNSGLLLHTGANERTINMFKALARTAPATFCQTSIIIPVERIEQQNKQSDVPYVALKYTKEAANLLSQKNTIYGVIPMLCGDQDGGIAVILKLMPELIPDINFIYAEPMTEHRLDEGIQEAIQHEFLPPLNIADIQRAINDKTQINPPNI
jgi:hypothetical protein